MVSKLPLLVVSFMLLVAAKPASAQETPVPEPQTEQVYMVVEQMPQFPGGEQKMVEFISKNLKYPADALKNNQSGRVMVQFVVTESGEIKNANVVRSVSESIDKEALRLVALMPRWIPGKQNGKPVSVLYTTPIHFYQK